MYLYIKRGKKIDPYKDHQLTPGQGARGENQQDSETN